MDMTYKEAVAELKSLDGVTIDTLDDKPEIFLSSRFVRALELAREALEKIQMIAPIGDVYPDWHNRLSELEHIYDPVKDGEPWYRAKDVWKCIEEPDDE